MSMIPKTKKTKTFRSLWITLAVAFLSLSAVVLLIAGSLNLYFSLQNQRQLIINKQRFIAQDAAHIVKSFVQEKLGELNAAARLGKIANVSQQEQRTTLEQLLGFEPAFRQLVLLNSQNQETAKVSRLSSLVSYGFIKRIGDDAFSYVRQGKIYIGPVYIDEITSEPMAIMGVPAADIFGDFKGTLLAEVNLKFMWDLVGEIKVGNKGVAYVVDKRGNLIASGDISRVLKGENVAYLSEVCRFVGGNISVHKDSSKVVKGIQGNRVVANHVHLGTPDWAVVIELPVLEAYETVITSLIMSGSTIFLSFALAIVAGIYLSKRITKPIINLRDAAVRIGEGRLDTKIDIKKKDEIGDLAAAFNQMTENLRKTTTSIDNLNREVAERKKIEDVLRKNEEFTRRVIESSNDCIKVLDLQGRLLSMSGGGQKLLEIDDMAPYLNSSFIDFWKGKEREACIEAISKAKQGDTGIFYGYFATAKGTPKWWEIIVTPIKDADGSINSLLAVSRDITERRRAEERFLAVNSLQKLLLPPAPIEQKLKYVTDAVVRTLNADFARVWVIKPGDRCDAGCTHAEVTEGPHVCRFRDKCLHLMASSGRYTHLDGKVHRRVPFGCYKIGLVAAGEHDKFLTNEAATDPRVHNHDWVKELGLASFVGYRLAQTDGTPLGVLALFSKHPISPEEDAILEGIAHSTSMVIRTSQVEDALRNEKDFAESLTHTAQVIMLVLDIDARIVNFNPYMEEISGYKLEEVKGKDWFDTFSPKADHPQIKGLFKQAISGIQTKGKANSIITKDGREVLIEWYDKTLKDKDGQIIGLIAIGQDITERKRAEEVVENLNKDLKLTIARLTQSNRQLREFAYLAVHDLKTPLRGISILAQWLVNDYKEKFDSKGRQFIDLLVKKVERINKLINAILQYSTINRERHREHPVDLNALVGKILVEIRPPPNIKITINKNLPVAISRESHLRQVFQHLLTNAIRFMDKPQGRIAIDYTDKNDRWELSVADNGPGIEPQHFERIFRLFQVLGDSGQSKDGGIGLTLVRKIVELYDGQIWLTSELGQGSTFFFTIPKPLSVIDNEKLLLAASS